MFINTHSTHSFNGQSCQSCLSKRRCEYVWKLYITISIYSAIKYITSKYALQMHPLRRVFGWKYFLLRVVLFDLPITIQWNLLYTSELCDDTGIEIKTGANENSKIPYTRNCSCVKTQRFSSQLNDSYCLDNSSYFFKRVTAVWSSECRVVQPQELSHYFIIIIIIIVTLKCI